MVLNFFKHNETEIAEVVGDEIIIGSERDILDLMGSCNMARSVLLYQKNIAPAFFDLSSGIAGLVLQKFATYSMKCAMVVNRDEIKSKYFHELINEHSKSGFFRFYDDRQKAIDWLA